MKENNNTQQRLEADFASLGAEAHRVPGEIKSREVELGCESWTYFA